MLIPNLYTIKNTEKIDENNFKVQIELNPNHQV
ncbi:MAG TPA: 3-hydroxyacyl-ACP dehydratase, partial [Flavobacteriaceae bacterium]|nr:3-hydroxyacyl-ACP dehydratase [Flavobacteriaceae bacterium]